MAWARSLTPSLAKMFVMWFRTVFGLRKSRSLIAVLFAPVAMSSRISPSRSESSGNDRVLVAGLSEFRTPAASVGPTTRLPLATL